MALSPALTRYPNPEILFTWPTWVPAWISSTSANPTNCVWVRNYYVGAWVQDVAAAGNYLYVGDDHGLKVFDITNPRDSVLVGGNGFGPVSHLAVEGNY